MTAIRFCIRRSCANPEVHVRYFRDWLVSLAPVLARPTRNMEPSTSLKTLVPFFTPMKNRLFRRLLLVFIINGSALGVAVSVMLFYVEHVLQGNKTQAGIILLVYFGAAALSVPMWLLLSRRYTKTVAWFFAMVMTVVAMSLAVFLGAGDFALCRERASPFASPARQDRAPEAGLRFRPSPAFTTDQTKRLDDAAACPCCKCRAQTPRAKLLRARAPVNQRRKSAASKAL